MWYLWLCRHVRGKLSGIGSMVRRYGCRLATGVNSGGRQVQLGRVVVLGVLGVSLVGCAGNSGSGEERVFSKGSKFAASDRSFTYRPLKIEDFQAEALDRNSGGVIRHVEARSCISIQTAADTRIRSTATGQGITYAGTLDNVHYKAIFEPHCSWWNPNVAKARRAYVLQHEQIHFALTELSARELNEKVRNFFEPKTVFGQTAQEVEEKLRAQIRVASKEAIAMSSPDHTKFDEQTSFVYKPEKQSKWLEDVNRRLTATRQLQ